MNYKLPKNIWFYGIFASYAAFVGVMLVVIYIAVSNSPELIMKNYYQESLDFDENAKTLSKLERNGVKMSLFLNQIGEHKYLELKQSKSIQENPIESVDLLLFRPSDSELDRKIENLTLEHRVNVDDLKSGKWRVKAVYRRENGERFYQWFSVNS